jgi:hypothetical protein
MRKWVLKEKNIVKISAFFFETLPKSEDCSKSRTRNFVPAFLLSHWSIFFSVQQLWRAIIGTIFRITA